MREAHGLGQMGPSEDTDTLMGQRGGVNADCVTRLSALMAQLCQFLLGVKPLGALVFSVIK